jgi:cobalt/nickel transport system permease protein
MHIPDGFLDARTAVASSLLAAGGLGLALREIRLSLPPARVPLIGLASAFVFAAQMLNFPVAGGTSGHLIGATLAMVLLGPQAAVLVMSTVLILQCFLFADGGLTALGANIFNLALVAPGVGFLVYQGMLGLLGRELRGRLMSVAVAAWFSTLAAAIACAGQLALSGAVSWRHAFTAMGLVHMLIGLGESVITTLVVAVIARSRPELVAGESASGVPSQQRALVAQGLLVSLGLMLFVAPFACPWPDGLEQVAERLGFARRAAAQPVVAGWLADYGVPGLASPYWSTVVAGTIGTLVVFLVAWLLARRLAPSPGKGAQG